MNWTKDIPTEPGFYWHWDENIGLNIVQCDSDYFTFCGNEIPFAYWMSRNYQPFGYFLLPKLSCPLISPPQS